ncbi:MAG: AMP-binding protein [Planctomycetota bacterium]|jgi:acyl-[acyl-carrier-protein]-phospholipid O-acyltransferase/long-chain-fatty-acid--[acyl-carrier-protein] ligase
MLHHRFIEQAKASPDHPAIIDRFSGRRLTYRKTLIAALLLSRRIRKLDEGAVGVLLPNTAGSALTILAAEMAGTTPVMINYSTQAEENCRFAQNKVGFHTILTSRRFLEKIGCAEIPGMIFLEDWMASITLLEKAAAAGKAFLPATVLTNHLLPQVQPSDRAVILFTSGSEAQPKAVALTHANILANRDAITQVFHFGPGDTFLASLPFFHVFGFHINLWLPLTSGAAIVTHPNPLEYREIAGTIQREGVTVLTGTPTFLDGYARAAKPGMMDSLRYVIGGADRVPESLRMLWQKRHGKDLLEGYGTTETSPVIAVNGPETNRPGSVGLPLKGMEVRITDIQTGEPLPTGEEGKILVKGSAVMEGYLDDLEATSLRLRDGWYDTGDMGVLDEEGILWHRGRLRRFVKIGGEMVSLPRIEAILQDCLPEGVDSCMAELPDPRKGALLVAVTTEPVDEKALRTALAERLSAIEMPSRFLVLDPLPRLTSGKMDYRALQQAVLDATHR